MQILDPANKLHQILDQLIQGSVENPFIEFIADVVGVALQDADDDRIIFILAQLEELFPDGNRNIEQLLARLFLAPNVYPGAPLVNHEDIANLSSKIMEQEKLEKFIENLSKFKEEITQNMNHKFLNMLWSILDLYTYKIQSTCLLISK